MAGTRLANMHNNPFQNILRAAGRLIEHDYAINVITDNQQKIIALAVGEPSQVHDELVEKARGIFEVAVPSAPYDVVIAGVGAPKDANLYQASRGATYIGLSANPVVRDGGVILLPAELIEGAGDGRGEQNMVEILQQFGPTQALIDHMLHNDTKPGQQRAFMIAQLCQRYRLIVVGSKHPKLVQSCGIEHVATMEAATMMVNLRDAMVLIVPHAIQMLPTPAAPK